MRFFSLLGAASLVLAVAATGDRLVPVVVTHPDFSGDGVDFAGGGGRQ